MPVLNPWIAEIDTRLSFHPDLKGPNTRKRQIAGIVIRLSERSMLNVNHFEKRDMSEVKKVAPIAGANKGIGFEITRQMSKAGWTVFAPARNEELDVRRPESSRSI